MSEQERAGSTPTIEQLREQLGDLVDAVWPVAYKSGYERAVADLIPTSSDDPAFDLLQIAYRCGRDDAAREVLDAFARMKERVLVAVFADNELDQADVDQPDG